MSESYWRLISAAVAVALVTLYLSINRRYRWFYIKWKVLPRDIIGIWRFTKVKYRLYKVNKNLETIPKLFTKQVKQNPNKVALYYGDKSWTFSELEDFSNKIANYFDQEGYMAGDTVALLLDNRPDYVGIWLGLSKIGVVAALINTNLVSVSLVHSINAAQSKALIFGSDFEKAVNDVKEKLSGVKLYRYRHSKAESIIESATNLNDQLENVTAAPPVDLISKTKPRDKVIYIYTSGTTGLPKAAVISHARFIFAATALHDTVLLNGDDIFYNPLPLYHSSGAMVGIGQCLLFGVPNVIRTKFSASNFWKDCIKYNCTIANYIGETCRYILAAHSDDSKKIVHSVKKMAGNGLRRDVWEQFVKKFDIPQIYEFYASTEGNANLINLDNTLGAVGFLPPVTRSYYPLALIKCDEDTKEPIRNAQGLCIQCNPGESGILIGKINHSNTLNEFTGYADKKETNKKIIENVFAKGDMYFNSGDLLVEDEFGYFYFKDRTGDTYRWKGENVATGEVETVINEIVGLKDCVIYGVEVPNTEGRCGMIALVDPHKTTNIQELATGLKGHLPSYAIPLFLRIVDALPMTGTFKVKKVELQRDGFDLNKLKDPLYFFDLKKGKYVPLEDVYDDIISGKLKL